MSEERQNKLTYNEVRYRQALPYEIKIRMSETRLREFIGYYGEDGVAVSFSGGLDSTFALAFIRERYCDLLEYLSQRAVISEVFCDGVG